MNILLNTPLLKTNSLRNEFDNKVLLIFMLIIYIAVILGILIIDLTKEYSKTLPSESDNPSQTAPKLTRNA